MRRSRRALASVLLAAAVTVSTAASISTPAHATSGAAATYTNPVSAGFADTFADPTVVRGLDGLYYAYATSDPLRSGQPAHQVPIAASADLVSWHYVGDAFNAGNRPPYADPGALLWAPDVRYLDGRYVMYFVVTNTTTSPDGFDTAIGAATAPTPAGPWTTGPDPVVAPRPGCCGGYWWTIDPAELTDSDGQRYLYFGSYYGGIWVTTLSPDGLHATGTPTMVAIDNRYEGAYVVHRGEYYYLFASSANCCAGPTTGYAVSVGRATDPRGPFLDARGVSMNTSRAGGTPVVTQNGNRFVGTGHNGMVTDLSGQDYLVYHGIDRNQPYLDEPFGINRRPMLLDRLDWIDGWPVVRAGAGPSDDAQPAPVTTAPVQAGFDAGLPAGWTGTGWTATGGVAGHTGSGSDPLLAPARLGDDLRVEADLRAGADAAAGIELGYRDERHRTTVWLDRAAGRLVAEDVDGARTLRASAALPAGVDWGAWHNLAVEVRDGHLTALISELRQSGAVVRVELGGAAAGGAVGLVARGTAAADNVSAAPLYSPPAAAVPEPQPGALLPGYSDELDGSALGPAWSWVRPDPAAHLAGGQLVWPLESADLTGGSNNAGVLLRDAPSGDYTVETRLTLDLGVDTVRNYQQAGLVAYVGDDDFARLCPVAIWNTRQIEYGREIPYAGSTSYGGTTVGTPGTVTWLRLVHRVDPTTGEHRFRGASSVDGVRWTWSGVWTFPAGSAPRIGLVAHGGADPAVSARFDYVRVYAP
jgi:arabinan endo-1,5-alpha-L-arabinosidase